MNYAPIFLHSDIAPLSDAERAALSGSRTRVRDLRHGEDLVREGSRPAECHLVLDGVLCRYKILVSGRRQIIGVLVPGDLCDLSGLMLGRVDFSVGALTPARVAAIPYRALQDLTERQPRLGLALWRETLVEASVDREWVANIGARPAYQRIAHLLCEVALRLRAASRTGSGGSAWPMTQSEIADATGLSTVHVNRTLQQLRAAGLVAMRGHDLKVLDWPGLQNAGEFNPDYLFLGAGRIDVSLPAGAPVSS